MEDVDAKLAGVVAGGLSLAGGLWLARRKRRSALNQRHYEDALALAQKWGYVFHVPASDIMAIAGIESDYNPAAENHNERAEPVGGAWGMMQLLPGTANDLAKLLRQGPYAKLLDVQHALQRFDGTGASLLDSDVNVMFGTFYLRRLSNSFGGNFWFVAAAYQQGPGRVRKAIDGQGEVGELGKEYAEAAVARRQKLLTDGVA